MKKILALVVLMVLVVGFCVTHLGTSTKTTNYWVNSGEGTYELIDVREETISGIFDKEVDVTYDIEVIGLK